jgi:hypothetical protein
MHHRELGMLRRAGADVGRAAAALTASTLMQIATRLTLPLFAIPAIIGGAPVSHSLVTSAYLGLLVLLLLDVAGILAFASDRPLLLTGRGLQWALNRTIRRPQGHRTAAKSSSPSATLSVTRSVSVRRRCGVSRTRSARSPIRDRDHLRHSRRVYTQTRR